MAGQQQSPAATAGTIEPISLAKSGKPPMDLLSLKEGEGGVGNTGAWSLIDASKGNEQVDAPPEESVELSDQAQNALRD